MDNEKKITIDKGTLDCLDAVMKNSDDLKWGEEKIIVCPICGKSLKLSKSDYNGHLVAICETPKCFRLMS